MFKKKTADLVEEGTPNTMIKICKTMKMCSIATAAILPPPPSFLCSDGGQVVHVDHDNHDNHDNDDHNHLHKHHNHDYDDHHHNHDDDAQTVCRFVMMIMIDPDDAAQEC